ncbi:MAG: HigA family addiction module antitoxin [Candidatus Algichlamydia australiensis]|nr:HigA family addiction module antitoxin [Chlamydiales bacterium]
MRPIHPGEILKKELDEVGLLVNILAQKLSLSVDQMLSILSSKTPITRKIATGLSRFFGTSPQFWLNLQSSYNLKVALREKGKEIEKEVLPRKDGA